MKEIDINSWERKTHYEWFSSFDNPCFAIAVRMDVTRLLEFCKENNTSSFASVMFFVAKALNSIKPLRYRILDGKVYEITRANVAYTFSVRKDFFLNNRTNTATDYFGFCRLVKEQTTRLRENPVLPKSFNDTAIVDDIYCSCVPWIDFVSVSEPVPERMPENNCIPRVSWGKYTEENGRVKCTFSITANHSLADGYDVSQAFILLQKMFDCPENFTEQEV